MSTSSLHVPYAGDCETIERLSELLAELPDPDGAIIIRRRWYPPLRNLVDPLLALVLLIVSVPLVALAAATIKLTSHGPIFYCQTRVGRNGRLFTLIKLRTMVSDAEAATGPVWASSNDDRITAVGRCLRRLHLDELPQLLNVLAGQMSLVGPRPERPEFVQKLEWHLPHYRTRLKLRPGITGLTQLLLPPDSSIDSVRRKLVFDLYYIRCMNPWLDLRILGATGWFLVKASWKHLRICYSLPDLQTVERELRAVIQTAPLPSAIVLHGGHPVEIPTGSEETYCEI